MGKITFLVNPNQPWSGKAVSVCRLAETLTELGCDVSLVEAESSHDPGGWVVVTALDEFHLLSAVPPERRICWLRVNPVQPGPIAPPTEDAALWIAASHWIHDRFPAYRPVAVLSDPTPVPAVVPGPEGRKGLLFVGRVERSKGLSLALNMLGGLPPTEHLTIIGPSSVSNLTERIAARGLGDRATWLGALEPEEIYEHYQKARWLIAPCAGEPFGMPVVEALAHGCTPLAASGSGGPDEILGGLPYPINPNPVAFADAVLNLRPMVPEQARKLALPYESRNVAQRFLRILEAL